MDTYVPHMRAGSVYRLNKYYGSQGKTTYKVVDAEPNVTISFSWGSVLSVLENIPVGFPENRFRFCDYEEFESGCVVKCDLYDFVGHIKLVSGQLPNECELDKEELDSTSRISLHVQSHDGPVIKLNLWDKAATTFFEKFKTHGGCPSVILVTTVNPKHVGGAFTISSLASSRVFTDTDVEPSRDYLTWLGENLDVANMVNPDVVTKTETVTITDLICYMKQEGSQEAWFECKATVNDVVHETPWYYIGCQVCHTKATKGATTLMCKKCGKTEITAVPLYLTKLSVYDDTEQAHFVLLCDAGVDLTGKKASKLVEEYFEANEGVRADHLVPVPQALRDTIGQTRKFKVKISNHNLTGKTQSLTVTKVLPVEEEAAEGGLEENMEGPAAE